MLLLDCAVCNAGSLPPKSGRANLTVTEGPNSSAWGCCCCCCGTGGGVELGMWERESGAELDDWRSGRDICRLAVDDRRLLVDDCRSPVT